MILNYIGIGFETLYANYLREEEHKTIKEIDKCQTRLTSADFIKLCTSPNRKYFSEVQRLMYFACAHLKLQNGPYGTFFAKGEFKEAGFHFFNTLFDHADHVSEHYLNDAELALNTDKAIEKERNQLVKYRF